MKQEPLSIAEKLYQAMSCHTILNCKECPYLNSEKRCIDTLYDDLYHFLQVHIRTHYLKKKEIQAQYIGEKVQYGFIKDQIYELWLFRDEYDSLCVSERLWTAPTISYDTLTDFRKDWIIISVNNG